MPTTDFTLVPKKERPRRSLGEDLAYFALLFFFFGSLVSFLFFEYSRYLLEKQLSEVKTAISEETSGEFKKIEEEVKGYQFLFSALESLSSEKKQVSPLFSFLEKNLHPVLEVSEVELDPGANIIKIKASAPSFLIVAQQIRYLQEKSLAEIFLKTIDLGEEGISLEAVITLPQDDQK